MRNNRALQVLLLFVTLDISGKQASAHDWTVAQPGYTFQFPRDHFAHPDYETEWWYYTGNIHSSNGHRYGFELTFFRQGQKLSPQVDKREDNIWRPSQIYLAHLALSDIDGKRFYHVERLNRAGPGIAGADQSQGAYWNGNWRVRWLASNRAKQQLTAVCDRFSLTLTLSSMKAPVIQGNEGISQKGPGPGQASHYISLTRLEAQGRLTENGSTEAVTGLAWMDHEFFTEPKTSDLTGWDWFSIQLSNDEELMVYRLRTRSGAPDPYSSGTYIDSQGKSHFLSASSFSLTPGSEWHSPQSGARYPLTWRIQVPSLQLDLTTTTDLPDQELRSAVHLTPPYWEGAVRFEGSARSREVSGVGYLEMTGYSGAVRLSGIAGR